MASSSQDNNAAAKRISEKNMELLAQFILTMPDADESIKAIAAEMNSGVQQRQTNRKSRKRARMEEEEERTCYMRRYRVQSRNLSENAKAYNLRTTKTILRDVMVTQLIDEDDIKRDKAMYDGEDLKPEPGEDDVSDGDDSDDLSYVPTDDGEAEAEEEDAGAESDTMSFDSDLPLAELARLAEKQRNAKKASKGIHVNIVPDNGSESEIDSDFIGSECGSACGSDSYAGSFADSDEEDLPLILRAQRKNRRDDEMVENNLDVLDKTSDKNWPGFWEIVYPFLEVGARISIKYDTEHETDLVVYGIICTTTLTDYDLMMVDANRSKKGVVKDLEKIFMLDSTQYASPFEWAKFMKIDVDTVHIQINTNGSGKDWEKLVDVAMSI